MEPHWPVPYAPPSPQPPLNDAISGTERVASYNCQAQLHLPVTSYHSLSCMEEVWMTGKTVRRYGAKVSNMKYPYPLFYEPTTSSPAEQPPILVLISSVVTSSVGNGQDLD